VAYLLEGLVFEMLLLVRWEASVGVSFTAILFPLPVLAGLLDACLSDRQGGDWINQTQHHQHSTILETLLPKQP